MVDFQSIIEKLNTYWKKQGILIGQPYGMEVGAGTANPNTFFRVLGPEPFSAAYVEPSRRPADGRYGENPNRLQHYFQYQIILKPAPINHIQLYLNMLEFLGIDLLKHDIRFVEDNWASPSLKAWGVGWEVWLDSMEVTQYTYFQQMGGVDLELPTIEITLGLERLAMYINDIDDYRKISWNDTVSYADLFSRHEYYQSKYNYEQADVQTLLRLLKIYEGEAKRLLELQNFWAAYDFILRMSHVFNILDARGAASDSLRRELFNKMGSYLSQVARLFIQDRKLLNYPLLARDTNKSYDEFTKEDKLKGVTVQSVIKQVKEVEFDKRYNTLFKNVDQISVLNTPSFKNRGLLLEFEVEDFPVVPLTLIENRLDEKKIQGIFQRFNITYSKFIKIVTPTRIGFILTDVQLRTDEIKVYGPPEEIAFRNGVPTKVLTGLLNKYKEKLIRYSVEHGRVVFYLKHVFDAESFYNSIYKYIFSEIPYKHMKLKNQSVIRPIRSYIFYLQGQKIDISGKESGMLNNYFFLPKWLGAKFVQLQNIDDYINLIQSLRIIVSPDDRVSVIRNQLNQNKFAENLLKRIHVNAMLTESPVLDIIPIDKKYAILPHSIVDYVLWSNQKFLVLNKSIKDKATNKKMRSYLAGIVSNNPLVSAMNYVTKGALKVIQARLEDAIFYYSKDSIQGLDELQEKAANKQLGDAFGTLADKRRRLKNIILGFKLVHNNEIIDNLLKVIKLDLVTNLGIEFPALEGQILADYLYKGKIKVDFDISHRLLQTLRTYTSDKPVTKEGMIIALADELDDLFLLAYKKGLPSGSADPYDIKSITDRILHITVYLYEEFGVLINLDQIILLLSNMSFYAKLHLSTEFITSLKRFLLDRARIIFADAKQQYKNIRRSIITSLNWQLGVSVVHMDSFVSQIKDNDRIDLIKRIYNLCIKSSGFKCINGNEVHLATLLKNIGDLLNTINKLKGYNVEYKKNHVFVDIINRINYIYHAILDLNKPIIELKHINHGDISKLWQELIDLLQQYNIFIEKYRIQDDNNPEISEVRKYVLRLGVLVISYFVNIPAILNQA